MMRKRGNRKHGLAIALLAACWAAVDMAWAATHDAPFAALEFDGSQSRVTISHHDDLNPDEANWTCAFWVKLNEDFTVGHSKFIAKRDGSGTAGGFYIGSQFAPACNAGNRQNLNFRNHLSVGEWTHVAVQIDRDNDRLRAFINGDQVAEAASLLTGAVNARANLVIGGDSAGALQGNHSLIRDVRIWKGPLVTAETIRAVMAGVNDVALDGLVGHWPLNDGSGEVARDLAADRHGEVANAEWIMAGIFARNLPESMDVNPGDAVTFGPVELGFPKGDVSYQWFRNDEPIPGAVRNVLIIPDFTADHTGTYHVEIRDDSPHTPIDSTALTIEWPIWEKVLEPASARLGEPVVLGPVALYAPRGTVRYQWYRDGRPIEGVVGDTLPLDPFTADDIGTYHVVVDDDLAYTPIRTAKVELNQPDWPMWRYDPGRSAETPHVLAEDLHLQWVRELPSPLRAWRFQWDDHGKLDFDISYTPVVMGDRVFVPSNVSDSLTAYSLADGRELWRFHADGPVRLAPVAWRNRVYVTSDDGHLYCLNAETGELIWKHMAAPTDQRHLGNERIISFWAARGGPVIKDGTIYYAAGVWPMHGVFIFALDAITGEVQWINDTISSDYVALPHGGAYGYGGLSPQGYIAADNEQLVIAAGRGQSPVFLDRATGEMIQSSFRGRKGGGGYAVHSGGLGMRGNTMLQDRLSRVADQIDGEVFYKLAAHDRLVVMTEGGRLYVFGPSETDAPVVHAHVPEPVRPRSDAWGSIAQRLLDDLGEAEGYALMLGVGSGDLLREILLRSELHVVVVESDGVSVRALRDELVATGMAGRRAAVIRADPGYFTVQPYLFSMVLSESGEAAGLTTPARIAHALGRLRPYGGVAFMRDVAIAHETLAQVSVDGVEARLADGMLFARRQGPLPGAGQWTHQYHDPANSVMSRDTRVRLPLGVLWYGGPNNHDILPRHSGGPRPMVVGGRIFYLGVETLGARCVYTGRILWSREFPGIGHHATNLALEERWQQGANVYMTNIPGTTYVGSPLVSMPDAVYLRHEASIHKLDPATGETRAVFPLPGSRAREIYDDEDAIEWGHMHAQGDYLVVTVEPHLFEDQRIGWTDSYTATSSRRIAVLDRHTGRLVWEREARIGFRHNAIASHGETVYVVDGLSRNAVEALARRGEESAEGSLLAALDLRTGEERWTRSSEVFGTYLMVVPEHDILLEGGSQDLRRRLDDEPRAVQARRATTGEVIWTGGAFTFPGAVHGEMLIPGRPGPAISVLTGEPWQRVQPYTGASSVWQYRRAYGCNTLSANPNMLLFRSGYASFFDLASDSGTGNIAGFRSGCTANLVVADGVLSALDYTRTCTCSYAMQTSLALVHMPDDPNIEFWTRLDGAAPNPAAHGLNFGAPGRRVDGAGMIWYDEPGTRHRHPSAITANGGSPEWVAASLREGNGRIDIADLLDAPYRLRLHFSELDERVRPGERVFDVWVDGENVLASVDVVELAGGSLRGVVKDVAVRVENGSLTLELRQTDGSRLEPVISGIELRTTDEHAGL